jgi:chromosome segregation ATPase
MLNKALNQHIISICPNTEIICGNDPSGIVKCPKRLLRKDLAAHVQRDYEFHLRALLDQIKSGEEYARTLQSKCDSMNAKLKAFDETEREVERKRADVESQLNTIQREKHGTSSSISSLKSSISCAESRLRSSKWS